MRRDARAGRLIAAAAIAMLAITGGVATVGDERADAGVKKARWLKGVTITEYFPAPEKWGVGRRVKMPGTNRKARVDWLFGIWGLSGEGDGVSHDGKRFHISSLGSAPWVTRKGRKTRPTAKGWSSGSPYWRNVGWRNRKGHVTFPLRKGGWSKGKPRKFRKWKGIRFSKGPSRPLRFWRSIAVDPDLIPLGSKVYVPRYRKKPGHGCMKAVDTGGAIIDRHIDVYRPAPKSGGGNLYRNKRIYVVPPGRKAPKKAPKCLR